jgi:hypothetical protein
MPIDAPWLLAEFFQLAQKPTHFRPRLWHPIPRLLSTRRWTGEFPPLEIKTLRVPLTVAGKNREVSALEQ